MKINNFFCLIFVLFFLTINCLFVNASDENVEKFIKEPTSENFNNLVDPSLEMFLKINNPTLENFQKLNYNAQKTFLMEKSNIEQHQDFAKEYLYSIKNSYSEENKIIAKTYFTAIGNIDKDNQQIFSRYIENGLNIKFEGFTGDSNKNVLFLDNVLMSESKDQSIDLKSLQGSLMYGLKIKDSEILIIPLSSLTGKQSSENLVFLGDLSFNDDNIQLNHGMIQGVSAHDLVFKAYSEGLLDIKEGSISGYPIESASKVRIMSTENNKHKIYMTVECIDGICFNEPAPLVLIPQENLILTSDKKPAQIKTINSDSDLAFSGNLNIDYTLLIDNNIKVAFGRKLILNGNMIDALNNNKNLLISATLKKVDEYVLTNNKKECNIMFFVDEKYSSDKNTLSFALYGDDFKYSFNPLYNEKEELKDSNILLPSNIDFKKTAKNKRFFDVGDKSSTISMLQEYLGYEKIDGIYSEEFKDFVIKWQKSHEGMNADGLFGASAYSVLRKEYEYKKTSQDHLTTITLENKGGSLLYQIQESADGKNFNKISSYGNSLITIGEQKYLINDGLISKLNQKTIYANIADIELAVIDKNNDFINSIIIQKMDGDFLIETETGTTGTLISDYIDKISLKKFKSNEVKISKTIESLATIPLNNGDSSALDLLISQAQKYNIDPKIILSIIAIESGGNPYSVSSTGCAGILQFCSETAYKGFPEFFDPKTAQLCKPPVYSSCSKDSRFDVESSIMAATKYVNNIINNNCKGAKQLLSCIGISYNGGPSYGSECGKLATLKEINQCVGKRAKSPEKSNEIKDYASLISEYHSKIVK